MATAEAVTRRLGYLLKHAQLRFAELSAEAMAPFGVNGRQLAVLTVLADRLPVSQQEVASRLGVDRTSMVILLDELERKRLVDRYPSPEDRRKNVVVLTASGLEALEKAGQAGDEAELRFLGSLSKTDAAAFRRLLTVLVTNPDH
jgi:DNA-binding MarR family transcriptional regulator